MLFCFYLEVSCIEAQSNMILQSSCLLKHIVALHVYKISTWLHYFPSFSDWILRDLINCMQI